MHMHTHTHHREGELVRKKGVAVKMKKNAGFEFLQNTTKAWKSFNLEELQQVQLVQKSK